MKKSWSANKLINFLVLSSFMLVMLFAGVFTIKNADFLTNNNSNLEQLYGIDLSSDNNLLLSGSDNVYNENTQRDVVVYHNSLGVWQSVDDETKKTAVIYIDDSTTLNNQYIFPLLKDFKFLDNQDNYVSGEISHVEKSGDWLLITFTPANIEAYKSVTFSVYCSTKYNQVYCEGGSFYSDSACTKIINSFSINNLIDKATIYITSTWELSTIYELPSDKTVYIKPYNLSQVNMISVDGNAGFKGNFIIDGENGNKILFYVHGANKTLTLEGVTIQNNANTVINANSCGNITLNDCNINDINSNDSAIKINALQSNEKVFTIKNCVISNIINNSTSAKGGAINCFESKMNIEGSTFTNCSTKIEKTLSTDTSSTFGGAVYFKGKNIVDEFIIKDTIIENCKSESAGAIYLDNTKLYLTSTENSEKFTKISNNTTSISSDKYADIEARNSSIVYVSGNLQIESSLGVVVNTTEWYSSGPIQLNNYSTNLLNKNSIINVKLINTPLTLLNKSTLVLVPEDAYDNKTQDIEDLFNENVFNLVNTSVVYDLRFNARYKNNLIALSLGWLDDGATVYYRPNSSASSDGNLGTTPATAFYSWDKVIRATLDNVTVKLLSSWYVFSNFTLDGDASCYDADSVNSRKIARIIRDPSFIGSYSHMIVLSASSSSISVTIKNIILDGGSLSVKTGAILYSNNATNATVTIDYGTELINNLNTDGIIRGSAISFYKYTAGLSITNNKYLYPSSSGISILRIKPGVVIKNNYTKHDTSNVKNNYFGVCVSAGRIEVDGLNINNNSMGCGAYLESTSSTRGFISNSSFSNSALGLMISGHIDLSNVNINNNSSFGVVVAPFCITTGKINLTNCQITGSNYAISSYYADYSTYGSLTTVTLSSTVLDDNEKIIGYDFLNGDNKSKLHVVIDQNLTIKNATSTQICIGKTGTTGTNNSLTIEDNRVISITDCTGSSGSLDNIIMCDNLYAGTSGSDRNIHLNFNNNSGMRPLYVINDVVIDNANFINNSHGIGSGGAIYAGGTVSINNAYFAYNSITKADSDGGAICSSEDTVIVKNGKFFNNVSTRDGGSICCNAISIGNVEFKNNSATRRGGAIYISSSTIPTFSTSETLTHENNSAEYGGFICAYRGLKVTTPNTTYKNNTAKYGCVIATGVGYSQSTDEYAVINSGKYINNRSIIANSVGGVVYSTRKITIKGGEFYGNGFGCSDGSNGGVAYGYLVEITGGTFGDEGKGNTAHRGGVAYSIIQSSSYYSILINGGNFQYNLAYQDGGVAYSRYNISISSSTSSQTLFEYNEASYGGVLYLYNESGSGAIYIASSSKAEFLNNRAEDNNPTSNNGNSAGGAIWSTSNLYIYGNAYFDSNSSSKSGGAIYCSGTINISGGTFTNNHAVENGGCIYDNSSSQKLTISGGVFGNETDSSKGNKAKNGGAIFKGSGALEIKNTTPQFYNNFATTNGGAIYTGGTVSSTGANFKYNYASNGGAVYSAGKLTISGGTYHYNKADNGGAFYCNSTITTTGTSGGYSLNLEGGTFTNNYVTGNGGAFYIRGSAFITGLNASYNFADKGAFLYNTANAEIRLYSISSSQIQYNHSTSSGSVFYATSGTLTLGIGKASSVTADISNAVQINGTNTVGSNGDSSADIHVRKINVYTSGADISCSVGVTPSTSRESAPIYYWEEDFGNSKLKLKILGTPSLSSTQWVAYLRSGTGEGDELIYSYVGANVDKNFYGANVWGFTDDYLSNAGFQDSNSGVITSQDVGVIKNTNPLNYQISINWTSSGSYAELFGVKTGYNTYYVGLALRSTKESEHVAGNYQGDSSFTAGNPNSAPTAGNDTSSSNNSSIVDYVLVYDANVSVEGVYGSEYAFKTVAGIQTFINNLKTQGVNVNSLTIKLKSEMEISSAFTLNIPIFINFNGFNITVRDNVNITNVNFIGSSSVKLITQNNVTFTKCSFTSFGTGDCIILRNGNLTLNSCVFKDNNRTLFNSLANLIEISGTSHIEVNANSSINIGSGNINFNEGSIIATGNSSNYAITCGQFNMTSTNNKSLILSEKAIFCSAFNISDGIVISNDATINGQIVISGSPKISGNSLIANNLIKLSDNPNITARLKGSIEIVEGGLTAGAVIYVESDSTNIATFNGNVPTSLAEKQNYTNYYFKVYNSLGESLKLDIDGNILKVSDDNSTNIWYFDQAGSYSQNYFLDCDDNGYFTSFNALKTAYSSKVTSGIIPTVYVVSTITISSNIDGENIVLTRWNGFSSTFINIESIDVTISNLVIDSNGVSGSYNVIKFSNTSPNTSIKLLTLNNVTVYNSSGKNLIYVSGCANDNKNASLEVTNCYFYNNISSVDGGVIYADKVNSVTINSSSFVNNKIKASASDMYGGVLYATENTASVTINSSKFINNSITKGSGGALYLKCPNVNIENSEFKNNVSLNEDSTVLNFGGAIYSTNAINIKAGNKFIGNKNIYGGAIAAEGTINIIGNVLFESNSAYYGGAIYSNTIGDVSSDISGICTFRGNTSYISGGAIYITDNTFTVNNGLFDGNSSNYGGGGFYVGSGATLNINGGEFNNNTGNIGGVISTLTYYSNQGWTINITGGNFKNNNASTGGFIYCFAGASGSNMYNGDLTIKNATVENNSVNNYGSAILADCKVNSDYTGSTAPKINVIIENCDFNGNITSSGVSSYNITGGLISITATNEEGYTGSITSAIDLSIKNSNFSNNNIKLTNSATTNNLIQGGILYFNSVGSFVLTNCNFENNITTFTKIKTGNTSTENYNTEVQGGVIYISTNKNISIENCNIKNNSANSVVILGVKDNSCATVMGGAVYIEGSTTLTLNNTKVINNSANALDVNNKEISLVSLGGAIYSNGDVVVQGGSKVNSNYAIEGSAIYTAGQITVNNSEINNNFGTNNVINTTSSVYIENSEINGNILNGSNIINANEVNITESIFSGNTIFLGKAINSVTNLIITNSKISANNLGSGKLYNVGSNCTVEIKDFEGNNEIYGNVSSGSAIIVKNDHYLTISGYLIQYNKNSKADAQGGAIYLGNEVLSTKLEDNIYVGNIAQNGGSIYIAQDNLQYLLNVQGGNVKTINGAIYIAEGITFTLLEDSVISYNVVENGSIYNNGYVTIKNAKFVQNSSSTGAGSSIYNSNSGTVLIEKAIIESNSAYYGGAIYNKGKFNIASASINANKATNGGVIYNESGNLSINTCKIDNVNEATNGGFVYNNVMATFVINGGSFNKSKAVDGGFLYNCGTFVMNKGSIYNNESSSNGGAIYSNNGKSIINNGEILTNKGLNGSAIYLANNSRFEMFDGVIAENTGSSAIYSEESIVSLKNIDVYGNTSNGNGGAIYLKESELYSVDSSYDDNTAVNGGAIYAEDNSKINIRRVDFNSNIANENGGVIFAKNSQLLLQAGVISGSSSINGGAIYLDACLEFNFSEIEFSNNLSNGYGSVIYSIQSNGDIVDCDFYNNGSDLSTGIIYFGQANNISILGSEFIGNRVKNGTIYVNENYGNYEIGNIIFNNNNATERGAGIYLGNSEIVLHSSILFKDNESYIEGDLYYSGGRLRVKGATKLTFESDSLHISASANKNILEPGLKEGSDITVTYDVSDANKYVGSYFEDSYITTNDLKYVTCFGFISNLKLAQKGNKIIFEQAQVNDLTVVASDVVVTVDGTAHKIDKSDFQVFFKGSEVKSYYIYYNNEIGNNFNVSDSYKNSLLNKQMNREEVSSFDSNLENMINDLNENDSIDLRKESPSIRAAGKYNIYYLVVYVEEINANYYHSYYQIGNVTLSVVPRSLVLENIPVATIVQKTATIRVSDVVFSDGLITSDGFAVAGAWSITHYKTPTSDEYVEVEGNAHYDETYLYKATFVPYATNLFGNQTIICDVNIETYFTELYFVKMGDRGYFTLDKNNPDSVINIPISEVIDKMLDNANILFGTTYVFEGNLTLNINKNINFIKVNSDPIFKVEREQSLTINVGVGNLYLYDNSGKTNPLINNEGAVTLGAGVNLTKYTLNQNAILNNGENAMLTLNGAKIYFNTTESDGIVKNINGTVLINGGEYFANSTRSAGLLNSINGTVYINGGEIYGNNAQENGGAVYMDGGTLVLNGGKIRHNTAGVGGGIYLQGDYTFNYNGTKIILNKAENGADIYLEPLTAEASVYMLYNEVVSSKQFKDNLILLNINFTSNNSNDINSNGNLLASIFSFILIVSIGIVFIENIKKLKSAKRFKQK